MAPNLTDQTILITGASSGIGKATALACAQAGMHVAVVARRADRLNEVAKEIQSLGRETLVIACDVQSDEQVHAAFQTTLQHWPHLDAVFANAGYGLFETIEKTTDEQIRDIFETNFYGTLRCIQQAIPIMKQQATGGHLLLCASACSEISLPGYGIYAATKAAQDSLGGALRAELAHTPINVTTVHPIGTYTEFFPNVSARAGVDDVGLNTPSLFMQRPEKVAKAIVRCLRKPKPEVWPAPMTRFGLALTTAFPSLAAMVLGRMASRHESSSSG